MTKVTPIMKALSHYPFVLRRSFASLLWLTLWAALSTCPVALSQEIQNAPPSAAPKTLTLVEAMMCEKIDGLSPVNPAVVFSIGLGRVSCFTSFDPVPEDTYVVHSWYFRDKLSTRIKLSLQPPRWSTFSSIQLREADQGPWRVEVTDREGNLLRELRFSITD